MTATYILSLLLRSLSRRPSVSASPVLPDHLSRGPDFLQQELATKTKTLERQRRPGGEEPREREGGIRHLPQVRMVTHCWKSGVPAVVVGRTLLESFSQPQNELLHKVVNTVPRPPSANAQLPLTSSSPHPFPSPTDDSAPLTQTTLAFQVDRAADGPSPDQPADVSQIGMATRLECSHLTSDVIASTVDLRAAKQGIGKRGENTLEAGWCLMWLKGAASMHALRWGRKTQKLVIFVRPVKLHEQSRARRAKSLVRWEREA
ncbi:hypothetical protein BDK51DRAFT_32709 [Blyttiomyces helicus]|uniref:Uncharacterized protein n=1 Tax=Blyttiomyces helicus TaxID=388810 RepID=A0A4P9VYQ0_9FUNG|nr:hypothetical protein BDK51DRAFT_32709 [Blyttiomyces helicus]|eukprot:RKO84884.1 hypothetical protein BDK51DRAFT_32709 [Blyttiomyces helicus]